jgi:hypothetical protein
MPKLRGIVPVGDMQGDLVKDGERYALHHMEVHKPKTHNPVLQRRRGTDEVAKSGTFVEATI